MTWHCIALLAPLTGQTWQRCLNALNSPLKPGVTLNTIRACTTPSVSTSANQNTKYFSKLWQQNNLNIGQFASSTFHHMSCQGWKVQEMRRPECQELFQPAPPQTWELFQPPPHTWLDSWRPVLFLFQAKHFSLSSTPPCHQEESKNCFTSSLLMTTAYFQYFLSPWLIWCLTLIRDKLGHRRLLTRAG